MQSKAAVVAALAAALLAAGTGGCSRQTPEPGAARAKPAQRKGDPTPMVIMETSKGTVKIELDAVKAPVTVANFLRYVDEKAYDGTIFHRVMPNFMIQGGGFRPDMTEKPSHEPIKNEAGNGLKNLRGTLAMARTGVVDSATNQFFISVADNAFLNHKDETPTGFGYAVFGKVTEGMDVIDAIVGVPTGTVGPHENVPKEPVTIVSIRRADAP